MSYRNITVNDKQYKYAVGKVNTKIIGVGLFENAKIGELLWIPEYCECCGESLSALYSSHVNQQKLTVSPRHIAAVIKASVL